MGSGGGLLSSSVTKKASLHPCPLISAQCLTRATAWVSGFPPLKLVPPLYLLLPMSALEILLTHIISVTSQLDYYGVFYVGLHLKTGEDILLKVQRPGWGPNPIAGSTAPLCDTASWFRGTIPRLNKAVLPWASEGPHFST